ncbi:TRAFs-binding domain-containing protein [Novosphingobium decolorationis]|uniref:DUF4071 domain-containing protein n=1 Tax=Novosphingobium decolorationis TaxID=2698673 RepID=A0ABX8EAE1_9SPHN|nr:TRAFs-binding domain-containing protein [Novosphingobium decolorationis]QVM86112.1 DUF4071 domain-containing protein [Novosphingobium decolorationis]
MNISVFARIRQIARAGDTVRAWQMFESAGLGAQDSPESLALKGRLLKDRALRLEGEARIAMARAASAAYRASAGSRRATYPLINAATIAYLCGDVAQARADARHILAILESGDHEPETSYWLHATLAEARLLLGDKAGCRAALLDALEVAPEAWEDRAATIRQLREILLATGEGPELLEGLSPPPSLYFSGIMDLGEAQEIVLHQVEDLFIRERPGAAFGALAAGTDILVAEMALAHEVQLHVVLPGTLEQFRAVSVEPFGSHWGARFDRLVAEAHSVFELPGQAVLSQAGIGQACEIAMGLALRRAEQLASEALALHVGREGDGAAHGYEKWRERGLPVFEIRRDWPGRDEGRALTSGRMQAILASPSKFALAPDCPCEIGELDEGVFVAVFEDVRAALGHARRTLADAPKSRLGLVWMAATQPGPCAQAAQLAACLVQAADESEICAPWPELAGLELLEPGTRFEVAGEIVTPLGDIPIARFTPMGVG